MKTGWYWGVIVCNIILGLSVVLLREYFIKTWRNGLIESMKISGLNVGKWQRPRFDPRVGLSSSDYIWQRLIFLAYGSMIHGPFIFRADLANLGRYLKYSIQFGNAHPEECLVEEENWLLLAKYATRECIVVTFWWRENGRSCWMLQWLMKYPQQIYTCISTYISYNYN